MSLNKVLGSLNLIATITCIVMMGIAVLDSTVALRWVGYFGVLAIFNGWFAYSHLKKSA